MIGTSTFSDACVDGWIQGLATTYQLADDVVVFVVFLSYLLAVPSTSEEKIVPKFGLTYSLGGLEGRKWAPKRVLTRKVV